MKDVKGYPDGFEHPMISSPTLSPLQSWTKCLAKSYFPPPSPNINVVGRCVTFLAREVMKN